MLGTQAAPYRARASRPARQLLLSCRATPPLRGGECAQTTFLTYLMFDVINPAKISEVVGRVPLATEEDVGRSLDQAQMAFKTWSATTPEERASLLSDAARDLRSALSE